MKERLRKWILKFLELDKVHDIYNNIDKTPRLSLTDADMNLINTMIHDTIKSQNLEKIIIVVDDTSIGRKISIAQVKKDFTTDTVEAECIYNGNRIDFSKLNGGI